MSPTTRAAAFDYFNDCWDYGIVDFETPDCAFFKVNAADLVHFPELSDTFAVKLTANGSFVEFATSADYVKAVAEEQR